ncbi:MAG: hypothetical protein CMG00_06450 [Candidatus Marinimicrobia bacterium]|nr:hypothetical protein [Candidatus Neomarinimicrobiota bacterium]
MDGRYKDWYENGVLKSEINYENDKLNGIARGWYENGQLMFEVNFINGKKE